MRQRFRPFRDRAMARRPGDEGRFALTPRARRIAGWVVAIGVVVAIAIVVGILGGNGDGTPVGPGGASPSPGGPAEITFGTALDATGVVAEPGRTNRYGPGDTFAYSVPPDGEPPAVVYVEVERTGGGPAGIVQDAATDGEQALPEGRRAIGFTTPADNLVRVFGPGEYEMRIFVDPTGDPIATGSFIVVGPPASSSPSAAPS